MQQRAPSLNMEKNRLNSLLLGQMCRGRHTLPASRLNLGCTRSPWAYTHHARACTTVGAVSYTHLTLPTILLV